MAERLNIHALCVGGWTSNP